MSLPPLKINKISVIDIENTTPSISDSESDVRLVEKAPEKKDVTNDSFSSVLFKLTVSTICGIFFGISLEKARVFEPKAIRDQMVFENFIMLKAFLSAASMGQLCFALMSVIPLTTEKFEKASDEYVSCFHNKGVLSSIVGSFALGAGMTLSGACPGMVLAQIGAWVPNAVFTLIGVLLGALSYGVLEPLFVKLTQPKNSFEKQQVHKKFDIPFIALALPLAIILAVAVFVIEWFWPWTKDLDSLHRSNGGGENVATTIAWPPYASGIFIGLLQIPVVLIVSDTIGGSSSYVTIVSQWVVTDKLQKTFPYLANKRTGIGNWWQVAYVTGAVIGATISAAASNSYGVALGTPIPAALFGGVLLLWGARMASGCTSGHGLSGMGLLAWLSFVAVPAMFGGAIVTGFAMQATGALDAYVHTTGAI